ncbi:CRISPR-associated endonuclease Cas9 [Elysia marginata]|uniref:CRISPR-associated endonuclease Cas9 n=1 Tax=Elysia marginata TaxID=1093978 RepID=A0AAV4JTP6_9GAST|nr:CRISPR-associated endonuclease Cas9 [Elysia marginata]
MGVRIVPLSTDGETNFEKGKNPKNKKKNARNSSINLSRTQKRGMRRNLCRYKQRREHLKKVLREAKIITEDTSFVERGGHHTIWEKRARGATDQIDLETFAQVLLLINKKRGYKSNRKNKVSEEGEPIDGMSIAKELEARDITPGQYAYELLKQGKTDKIGFYPSDLRKEFHRIWAYQKMFYPQLTDELKKNLKGKTQKETWRICSSTFNIEGINRKVSGEEKKLENYKWRVEALKKQLDLEQLTVVFQQLNTQIASSSKLLGEISDRSKELHFGKKTIGQYLYNQIKENKNNSLKNQVFYRQDYLDEFNVIWDTQAKFYPEQLTEELKSKIVDIIFWQRPLKSQKGRLSFCEFEKKEITDKDGKKKTIGLKVIPKSSPLFQEFRIWQTLNNLEFKNMGETIKIEKIDPDLTIRKKLFEELSIVHELPESEIIKIVFGEEQEGWSANFEKLTGNKTNASLYKAYEEILFRSGHEVKNPNKETISKIFNLLGINKDILCFDATKEGEKPEDQAHYKLWHLLYSYEGDNSRTGNEKLFKSLKEKYGFDREYAVPLRQVVLESNYGNLCAKAIKRILPHLKKGFMYDKACELEGYNHSHSLTKEENKKRSLKDRLELLPKNSLRSPVVEKILNQMVHVVNGVIDEYGKPDEIRVELARELRKSAKVRYQITSHIKDATKKNNQIKEKLKEIHPFKAGVRITKNDVVRYKLYQELELNSYKDLYTDTYIPKSELFSKKYDVDHIIPKSLRLDDSFSNKILSPRQFNIEKGDKTGIDAVSQKYGEEGVEKYKKIAKKLFDEKKISESKYQKLIMPQSKIPEGFTERDLKHTQYIAKKTKEILNSLCDVTTVIGPITDRLRKDWQLVDVMKELNLNIYRKSGLVEEKLNKDGSKIPKIIDWTKRNDHRHHAIDALIIAFTGRRHVHYFNYLNARKKEKHKEHARILALENKITFKHEKGHRLVKPPIPINSFRAEAKKHLEGILISFKAKNKVGTISKNKPKNASKSQLSLTPRGQLHNETLHSKSYFYRVKELKVGTKFNEKTISQVNKKSYREALEKRLKQFDNDPKKAFGGKNKPSENPIFLDDGNKLPEKISLSEKEEIYTTRKEVNETLNVSKVVDKVAREVLEKRLKQFNNNPQKAFKDLEKRPIWINKQKGISIKRVTIAEGKELLPLHYKKDNHGREILDEQGDPIPTDFVKSDNNHHVAIYRDSKGDGKPPLELYITGLLLNLNQVTDKNSLREVVTFFLNDIVKGLSAEDDPHYVSFAKELLKADTEEKLIELALREQGLVADEKISPNAALYSQILALLRFPIYDLDRIQMDIAILWGLDDLDENLRGLDGFFGGVGRWFGKAGKWVGNAGRNIWKGKSGYGGIRSIFGKGRYHNFTGRTRVGDFGRAVFGNRATRSAVAQRTMDFRRSNGMKIRNGLQRRINKFNNTPIHFDLKPPTFADNNPFLDREGISRALRTVPSNAPNNKKSAFSGENAANLLSAAGQLGVSIAQIKDMYDINEDRKAQRQLERDALRAEINQSRNTEAPAPGWSEEGGNPTFYPEQNGGSWTSGADTPVFSPDQNGGIWNGWGDNPTLNPEQNVGRGQEVALAPRYSDSGIHRRQYQTRKIANEKISEAGVNWPVALLIGGGILYAGSRIIKNKRNVKNNLGAVQDFLE